MGAAGAQLAVWHLLVTVGGVALANREPGFDDRFPFRTLAFGWEFRGASRVLIDDLAGRFPIKIKKVEFGGVGRPPSSERSAPAVECLHSTMV